MKRGLIAWDKAELRPEVFEARLARARERLIERDLPALVVYSDLGKSNYARFYSNFMPYFNRALLVISRDSKPFLLCGLSPRVYPWIQSVTILEEIIASPNLAAKLLEICAQRGWRRLGFLDPEGLPYDLHRAITAAIQIEAVPHEGDDYERAMHRRARQMALDGLVPEIGPWFRPMLDYELVGNLERRLRRAGAEDLVVLVTNGDTAPAPAKGQTLRDGFSVSIALEYRGHWAKIARHNRTGSWPHSETLLETISGPVVARFSEIPDNGRRLFHGDTFWSPSWPLAPDPSALEPL
jgi:Xaa-Pro aminopeptidase